MTPLFAKITFKTIVSFFTVGFICGALYYTFLLCLTCLSTFFSKDVVCSLLKCRYREIRALLKAENTSDFVISSHDVIRAVFILVLGIFLIFVNYALVDGIPRIYTIVSLLFGLCLAKVILKSTPIYLSFRLLFRILLLFLFLLLYPIKLIYRIITKKRTKNYSNPTI